MDCEGLAPFQLPHRVSVAPLQLFYRLEKGLFLFMGFQFDLRLTFVSFDKDRNKILNLTLKV